MKICMLVASLLFTSGLFSQKAQWVSTTENSKWKVEKVLTVKKATVDGAGIIEIYPENQKQRIIGFGGCFNEFGWEALKLIVSQ